MRTERETSDDWRRRTQGSGRCSGQGRGEARCPWVSPPASSWRCCSRPRRGAASPPGPATSGTGSDPPQRSPRRTESTCLIKRIYMLLINQDGKIRIQKINYKKGPLCNYASPERARLVRAQEWQQQAAQQGIITASRRISEQRTHCSSCSRAAREDITRLDSI